MKGVWIWEALKERGKYDKKYKILQEVMKMIKK